jgi:hypothetical protein
MWINFNNTLINIRHIRFVRLVKENGAKDDSPLNSIFLRSEHHEEKVTYKDKPAAATALGEILKEMNDDYSDG